MLGQIESLESRRLMSVSMVAHVAVRPAPSASVSSATRQSASKLYHDVLTLYRKGHVSVAELLQLESDGVAALSGATKPSAASVAKLKLDLKTAFSDKTLTADEKTTLTSDLNAILVSANISTASAEAVSGDVNAIIQSSGITSADVKLLVGDVRALASTFKAARA